MQRLAMPVYVFVGTIVWLSWFCAPVAVAIKLTRKRIGVMWLPLLVPLIFISMSELFGASAHTRRVMMHYAYEPAALVAAMVLVGVYSWRRIRSGQSLDFISFAVLWTTMLLMLKVLLLLDASFRYQVLPSRAFYGVYLVILIAVYHVLPRMRRWLLCSK